MKRIKLFGLLFSMLLTFTVSYSSEQNSFFAPEGDEYLAFAAQMPTPVGGLGAIYKEIKYPKLALQAGLEGKVYLIAFVNTIGIVEDVKVIKKLGGGCDEEAIAAVKRTKFTPGMSEGKPVKVKLTLQIQFKLTD